MTPASARPNLLGLVGTETVLLGNLVWGRAHVLGKGRVGRHPGDYVANADVDVLSYEVRATTYVPADGRPSGRIRS